jgi:hypothetical protein
LDYKIVKYTCCRCGFTYYRRIRTGGTTVYSVTGNVTNFLANQVKKTKIGPIIFGAKSDTKNLGEKTEMFLKCRNPDKKNCPGPAIGRI